MSLGKEAHNTSKKRKAESEVEFVDEELQTALSLIASLRAKKQQCLAKEEPVTKAFRLLNLQSTPARQRIIRYLHVDGTSPIFPLNVTGIIAEYDAVVNVHDSIVSLMFRKKLSNLSTSLTRVGVADPRLPDLISFHIASFMGCSDKDGIVDRYEYAIGSGRCGNIPVGFCYEARRAFCQKHFEIPKEQRISGHLHPKGICPGCWISCPCKSDYDSDRPRNGDLTNFLWKCVQCSVNICRECRNSECNTSGCPYSILSYPLLRGLCINCKPKGTRYCKRCQRDHDSRPLVIDQNSPDADSDRDSDGDRVNSDGDKIDSDEEEEDE